MFNMVRPSFLAMYEVYPPHSIGHSPSSSAPSSSPLAEEEVALLETWQLRKSLGSDSIETFQLKFWLEKSLEFWLEISYTKKR